MISARNLFNLALGVGWGICALKLAIAAYQWLFKDGPLGEPDALLAYAAIVAAGPAVFVVARRATPVRLTGATEDSLAVSIQDDRYANEFANLNSEIILPDPQ